MFRLETSSSRQSVKDPKLYISRVSKSLRCVYLRVSERRIRWGRILGALIVGVSSFSFPIVVSIDGFQFLNSARSLFGPEFSGRYAAFREPGYPIFLRAIHATFGSSDIWITLFQASAMSLAVLLSSRALGARLDGRRWLSFSSLALVFSLNPIFLGYSSMIFRQALLCLAVALMVWGVNRACAAESSHDLFHAALISVGGLLFGTAISTMVLYLAAVPGLIVLGRFIVIRRQGVASALSVKWLVGMVLTLVLVVSASWFTWNRVIESSSKPKSDSQTNFTVRDAISDALELGPVEFGRQFAFMARATLMLGPTDNMNGIVENELWTHWQLDPKNLCGAWDGIPDEEASYARAFLTSSCRSATGQQLMRAIRTPGIYLYKIASLALLVCPLFLLLRRRWRELLTLATPLWFLVLHASRDYSNDRYGIPLYPAAIACLAYLIVEFFGFLRHAWTGRHGSVDMGMSSVTA